MSREEELQNLCHREIENLIDDEGFDDLNVGTEVPIIKDCSFVFENQLKMYLGHADTDICIYMNSEELTSQLTETDHFKLWQNGDKEIRIPIVIIETKRGDADGAISTDNIRSRTIIAREMNEIFPFSSYVFVGDRAGAVSPGKIYRAGKHYDEFYLCPQKADSDWVNEVVIDNAIKPHLQSLQLEGIISRE